MKKLISELKVGDTVMLSSAWGEILREVTKVTDCFVFANSYKFKKVNKTEQKESGKYGYTRIYTITEEEIADFRRKEEIERRRIKLAQCHFNGLTDEVINQIYELVFKEEN